VGGGRAGRFVGAGEDGGKVNELISYGILHLWELWTDSIRILRKLIVDISMKIMLLKFYYSYN